MFIYLCLFARYITIQADQIQHAEEKAKEENKNKIVLNNLRYLRSMVDYYRRYTFARISKYGTKEISN